MCWRIVGREGGGREVIRAARRALFSSCAWEEGRSGVSGYANGATPALQAGTYRILTICDFLLRVGHIIPPQPLSQSRIPNLLSSNLDVTYPPRLHQPPQLLPHARFLRLLLIIAGEDNMHSPRAIPHRLPTAPGDVVHHPLDPDVGPGSEVIEERR